MSHTPGPWLVADDSSPVNLNVVAWVGKWCVYVPNEIPFGDALDDAYLIAAAPDLLAACETVMDWLDESVEGFEWRSEEDAQKAWRLRRLVSDAISSAKANGEEEVK